MTSSVSAEVIEDCKVTSYSPEAIAFEDKEGQTYVYEGSYYFSGDLSESITLVFDSDTLIDWYAE